MSPPHHLKIHPAQTDRLKLWEDGTTPEVVAGHRRFQSFGWKDPCVWFRTRAHTPPLPDVRAHAGRQCDLPRRLSRLGNVEMTSIQPLPYIRRIVTQIFPFEGQDFARPHPT